MVHRDLKARVFLFHAYIRLVTRQKHALHQLCLQPHNILLLKTNDRQRVRVKISDFGLTKPMKPGHFSISKASGLTGTEGWMAPEIESTDERSLSFAIDVFALGCIFYYVLSSGAHPFGDYIRRQENIRHGRFDLKKLTDACKLAAVTFAAAAALQSMNKKMVF